MSVLVDKRNEYEAKQAKLMKHYETAGDTYDFMKCEGLEGKTNKDRIEEVKKLNLQLQDVKSELDNLVTLENARRDMKAGIIKDEDPDKKMSHPSGDAEQKSIGKLFTESKAYTGRSGGNGPESTIDMDMKTAFTTSAGWAPESIRSGKIVEYATRPIEIIDTIPGGRISQAVYKYMEETTFTDNAAEASEAGQFGEAALALTERSQTVEKVAVNIPVTDEQLEDVIGIESYLNNRLTFMLRRRIGYQIINGSGSTPSLQGMLAKTGIQSVKHTGNLFDTIARVIMLIKTVGFADATVIYINSADWWSTKLRLARDDNGNYIMGNPNQPNSMNIWGVKVVENVSLAAGTILVADTLGYTMLLEKRGITLKITDAHASEFTVGTQRIRADVRIVMVILRAAAIAKITGV
jgi:HK97 family phage major capsid protein